MIHFVALLLYIGALLLWFRVVYGGPEGRGGRPAAWVTATAVAVHAAALASFIVEYGELPLVGLGPALSSLSLIMGLLLVTTLALGEVARVGIALLPIVVLVQGAALLLGVAPSGAVPAFQGFWFAAHVTLAFAGYGGAALAFAAGVLYLIQFRSLKDKHLGPAFRFIPPLATLDRVIVIALVAGFANLAVALVLGWAWTVRFQGTFRVDDPKVVWSVFTWLVIGGAITTARTGPRRGWRGAMAAVIAFVLVVGSYVALRLAVGGGGLLP